MVEFEDIGHAAYKMNREPGMMKAFRAIGQMFPGMGREAGEDLGIWRGAVAAGVVGRGEVTPALAARMRVGMLRPFGSAQGRPAV